MVSFSFYCNHLQWEKEKVLASNFQKGPNVALGALVSWSGQTRCLSVWTQRPLKVLTNLSGRQVPWHCTEQPLSIVR
jgi:hypothetical protein